MDLQGAPYAYAPMGSDREETKASARRPAVLTATADDVLPSQGFRFWETGYWKESLRGRPYHIRCLP